VIDSFTLSVDHGLREQNRFGKVETDDPEHTPAR
jgi:hypothetical protein